MTKRDFFRIIIRLFALYLLLLLVFDYLPLNISYFTYELSFWPFLILGGSAIFMLLMFLLLLKKTDLIIDVLKLDKSFDDDRIDFGNLGSLEIVKIALLFISGFLILDHLPEFLHYCYLGFKQEISATGLSPFEAPGLAEFWDYFRWFISGVNLIVGYLILANLGRLARLLIRFTKNRNKMDLD
ncbi:hypothetical protein WIW50_11985 [Flavobacteriaceae bacterium 3-367]|uniref:hypothetical protein n=1 Tax=Eudoraea algarum TaxID=3417568 RepID=UPI00328583DC